MDLQFQRRAEIALRSLQKGDQRRIERALTELRASDRLSLSSNPKFRLVATGFSGNKIAVYRATKRLRLVLSFEADACIIEDIVDHDRLDRLVKREGQE